MLLNKKNHSEMLLPLNSLEKAGIYVVTPEPIITTRDVFESVMVVRCWSLIGT